MNLIRPLLAFAILCIYVVPAISAVFHSEIEEVEARMPHWENTAASREQLKADLQGVLSGGMDRFYEKVYVDRAGRSLDPSFIPLLKQIAERQTPPEKEDTVFLAVRSLSALGVEKDYFFQSAKRYATHPKLAAVAIDAIADPYDQESIGILNGLKKEVAGTGNTASGAIMMAETVRSRARQYEGKDIDAKIAMAIDGAVGGVSGNFEYAGPNGGATARWIHGRFRDLCLRYPDKVALALFHRHEPIIAGENVISPEEVQKWSAQFLTPNARNIWEGLRRGESIGDLVKALSDRENSAVNKIEELSPSTPVVPDLGKTAELPNPSRTTKWETPIWLRVVGMVVLAVMALLVWKRQRNS